MVDGRDTMLQGLRQFEWDKGPLGTVVASDPPVSYISGELRKAVMTVSADAKLAQPNCSRCKHLMQR